MENFIVSARKYRPVTFDTVVGQNAITSTLKNAIRNNHLAQSFLFCGPRGVGKTTCARILAKTINCENLTSNVEACNQCKPCLSFNTSNSFNVFELDAASNNSVDDIRNLIDQVRIPPQIGQYKIYIIDEVHMLSSSAFNAFLKTLEEPPVYAKFILATTEKHKIIPTILSRCQIFDFNRITIDDIAKHLAYVAQSENVEAETDALHIIAQKADGALRDALSIFDQIVSFAGGNGITYKTVIENLNVLDYDYFFHVTDYLLQGNIPSTLLILNDVIEHGFDGHHFISGLGEHFRNLLVCKDASTLKLLEVGDNIRDKYKSQAQSCPIDFLLKTLDVVAKCDVNYKTANNKRLLLELALMQMCCILQQSNPANIKSETIKPIVKTSTTPVVQQKEIAKPIEEKKTEAPVVQNENVVNETPPVKQVVKKIVTGTSSILENLAEEEESKLSKQSSSQVNDNFEKPQEKYTPEQFEKAWLKFAGHYKNTNPDYYSTLTSRMPVLKEENLIELTIENKVQEKEISDRKLDILSFIRKELNNYSIQLQTVINKSAEKIKPFTPQDKFNKMAEKNPAIKKLKNEFDLEIDF
ncbi:MAG TPA: DNA polymerase III subunit gamma/tau [Bacteroidales bacterium]|nr:DNA polymerase III subunit gamma/tau [Bacteroidales bacterium]HPS17986.1 DNA polymerase III subunit gamma/tau [Bacteroidales bacterium]